MAELTISVNESGQVFADQLMALAPSVVRRLTVILGDPTEAEDVCQEAVIRAWKQRHRFDGADLRAWFGVIALRLALNEVRRRRRFLGAVLRLESREFAPTNEPELWASLSDLHPKERAALILHEVDGYQYSEIARMLEVPEGTVASWIHRAKRKLREQIERSEI